MTAIKVSPAEGRRVRDPVTMRVIDPGHAIDDTDIYWFRRIRDGDVTVDEPSEDEAQQPEAQLEAAAPESQESAPQSSRRAKTPPAPTADPATTVTE